MSESAGGGEQACAGRERLRVAVLAHVRQPIRPPFLGGVEAHTWHLVRGLAARGHDVTLLASGDSEAGVRLTALVEEHYQRALPWERYHGSDTLLAHLQGVYERACREIEEGGYDVVHVNSLHPLPIEHARRRNIPTLVSLHVPPFPLLAAAVHGPASPALRYTVTSRRQRTVWWPDSSPCEAHTVHNGIDPADWPFGPDGDGSAIWAGRITPNKGTHLAVEAARLAGVSLSIVGPIEDRGYFDERIAPTLDGSVRYLGHLSGECLAERFARASVLLFTPLWEEPFGLVAIEAMACGLPVACTDRGAVREVVGEAGAYAGREEGASLAEALERALAIPREVPRRRVERRFTRERMLDGYERLYRACMAGAREDSGTGARAPA